VHPRLLFYIHMYTAEENKICTLRLQVQVYR